MKMKIRDFDSYDDAQDALAEAGFVYVGDSNENASCWSFAPTITYHHPTIGAKVQVLWASGAGFLRWLKDPQHEHEKA